MNIEQYFAKIRAYLVNMQIATAIVLAQVVFMKTSGLMDA